MATPWFEPVWMFGAYYGGVGGTIIGLCGAALGCSSFFVHRGQGRKWILGSFYLLIAFGIASLLIGLVAVATGQPYGIWYPLVMLGALSSGLFGGLLPMILGRYREAEQRRVDAEGLRSA